MIKIWPSPKSDTRTCNITDVTKGDLKAASLSHIADVRALIGALVCLLVEAGNKHDEDKLTHLDEFFRDFETGFSQDEWYQRHKRISRHHLDKPDGVPEDVNLIDVLEHVVDCVAAGKARSGKVWPVELSDDVLQKSVVNTVGLLLENIKLEANYED